MQYANGYSMMGSLVLIFVCVAALSLVETSANNIHKTCANDEDCDPDSSMETALELGQKYPKSLDDQFACNSTISVYATVRSSLPGTNDQNPEFFGFSEENQTLCAPKAGEKCIDSFCEPGAYCVHENDGSLGTSDTIQGTCRCLPGTVLSSRTGICECPEGLSMAAGGVCIGDGIGSVCDRSEDCGYDPGSALQLTCESGKCECDSTKSVIANVWPSDPSVSREEPEFRGFLLDVELKSSLCAPKQGQPCAGRGYCSPRSYCVYDSMESWRGICECIPGTTLSKSTGMCECSGGQNVTANGECSGQKINETCNSELVCGLEARSKLQMTCSDGVCQCDPLIATWASVRTTDTSSHTENPDFAGYSKRYDKAETICAPNAGQRCVGKGYCAPLAYCVYTHPDEWTGMCHCITNAVFASESRKCECRHGFQYSIEEERCIMNTSGSESSEEQIDTYSNDVILAEEEELAKSSGNDDPDAISTSETPLDASGTAGFAEDDQIRSSTSSQGHVARGVGRSLNASDSVVTAKTGQMRSTVSGGQGQVGTGIRLASISLFSLCTFYL